MGIALVWFMYDFISYPFGIYSSTVRCTGFMELTVGGRHYYRGRFFAQNCFWLEHDHQRELLLADPTFSDGSCANSQLFYMPGTIVGALLVDRVGAKPLLIIALMFQAIVGFLMSGLYVQLSNHIAAFAVVYGMCLWSRHEDLHSWSGIFLAMGEVGPGNCIGLLAAKSSSTAVRGRFYGTAAAFVSILLDSANFARGKLVHMPVLGLSPP